MLCRTSDIQPDKARQSSGNYIHRNVLHVGRHLNGCTKILTIGAKLDAVLARVESQGFSSGAGMPDDELIEQEGRAKIHLQKSRCHRRTPLIAGAGGNAAVKHSALRVWKSLYTTTFDWSALWIVIEANSISIPVC